ncbi:MAG TPA: DUF1552 domain-containing protein, partial [Opitutaceae bacterium]
MPHADHDHAPDEHGLTLDRPLRPFTPPRNPAALSRRRFLRGAGVLMALPFLDSLPAWATPSAPSPTPVPPAPPRPYPQRFAAVFMGNGINSLHWWAKGSGATMELGRTLEPLAPLRAKLNVISGLFNKPAVGVGI